MIALAVIKTRVKAKMESATIEAKCAILFVCVRGATLYSRTLGWERHIAHLTHIQCHVMTMAYYGLFDNPKTYRYCSPTVSQINPGACISPPQKH